MKLLENKPNLQNFILGDLWKTKRLMYHDKVVIPYFLYCDDIEINNPLSSHSQAVCNFYYSYPCFPRVEYCHPINEQFITKLQIH